MAPQQPIVFDRRGEEHNSYGTLPRLGTGDWGLLKTFYGLQERYEFGYDQAQPGQKYVSLWAVELKAGNTVLQPRVVDANEQSVEGVLVWNYWPGEEALPATATPRYYSRGTYCWTDAAQGSCGWGYGSGSHIGDNGGPHCVWVNAGGAGDDLKGSDALDKIGWWDDHIIPNPWFKIVRKGGSGPLPTPGSAWLVDLDGDGEVVKKIEWIVGPFDPGPGDELGALAIMDEQGNITHHMPWEA
jgi:hypothetical protein